MLPIGILADEAMHLDLGQRLQRFRQRGEVRQRFAAE
jgi:hypothetical protein